MLDIMDNMTHRMIMKPCSLRNETKKQVNGLCVFYLMKVAVPGFPMGSRGLWQKEIGSEVTVLPHQHNPPITNAVKKYTMYSDVLQLN